MYTIITFVEQPIAPNCNIQHNKQTLLIGFCGGPVWGLEWGNAGLRDEMEDR